MRPNITFGRESETKTKLIKKLNACQTAKGNKTSLDQTPKSKILIHKKRFIRHSTDY